MGDVSDMTSLGSTVLYGTFAIMGGSSLYFLQKLLSTSQPDTLESPKLKNCESLTIVDVDMITGSAGPSLAYAPAHVSATPPRCPFDGCSASAVLTCRSYLLRDSDRLDGLLRHGETSARKLLTSPVQGISGGMLLGCQEVGSRI